eukprot:5159173-Prymnesium_polylepis.1
MQRRRMIHTHASAGGRAGGRAVGWVAQDRAASCVHAVARCTDPPGCVLSMPYDLAEPMDARQCSADG